MTCNCLPHYLPFVMGIHIGCRCFPPQSASDMELRHVACCLSEYVLEQTDESPLIENVLTIIWRDYNAYDISTRFDSTSNLWTGTVRFYPYPSSITSLALVYVWWRHDMKTNFALFALCACKPPIPAKILAQLASNALVCSFIWS